MAARQLQAWGAGDRDFRIAYDWRDMDEIAPSLPLSMIAAEDQDFARHGGFDFEAIEKARASNARGGRMRGASTISQQVAKNLFLWSGDSRASRWVRKGVEAWYTVLIEALWPKTRILERSEEHTSELQSLMRLSYAVFCLKKKNEQNEQTQDTQA